MDANTPASSKGGQHWRRHHSHSALHVNRLRSSGSSRSRSRSSPSRRTICAVVPPARSAAAKPPGGSSLSTRLARSSTCAGAEFEAANSS